MFRSILAFLLVAIGVVAAVVFSFVFLNIIKRSYKPQKAYPLLILIIVLFVFNLTIALFSLSKVTDEVDIKLNSDNQSNSLYMIDFLS